MTKGNDTGRPPPSLVDENEFLANSPRARAAIEAFLPSVRQLVVHEGKALDLLPVGSACLLWHRGQRYAITAKHVIGSKPDLAKYISGGDQTIAINFRKASARSARAPKNLSDISVALLDEPVADWLVARGCHFLTATQVGDLDVRGGAQAAKYGLLGYPLNMTKRIATRMYTSDHVNVDSNAISPTRFGSLGLNPVLHIAIHADPKLARSVKGVHSLRSLDGMSGGAIVRLPNLEVRGDLTPARLAGVIIEQDKPGRAIVGIRIERVLENIDRALAKLPIES